MGPTALPLRTFARPLLRHLRDVCLAFPETIETAAWGHPNFRAGRKTFCAFEVVSTRPSIAFRLPPGDVQQLLERKGYFETPYGRGLWVSCWADRHLNWRRVEQLAERSYRTVATQRMLRALERP